MLEVWKKSGIQGSPEADDMQQSSTRRLLDKRTFQTKRSSKVQSTLNESKHGLLSAGALFIARFLPACDARRASTTRQTHLLQVSVSERKTIDSW